MRAAGLELLDGPVESRSELEENLRDIERANQLLGGLRDARRAIALYHPKTVLDAGCGAADIPYRLVRDAQRRGDELHVACLDRSSAVLAIAAAKSGNHPALNFVQGDGRALPFADASFDLALCNLTLHHCDPEQAVLLLRELRRVARRTFVTDLRRSRVAWLAAKVLSMTCTHNRLSRHDAPLSVLRAYTPHEARTLAERAGWQNVQVRRTPFFRMALTSG